jgi:hypothetical protein
MLWCYSLPMISPASFSVGKTARFRTVLGVCTVLLAASFSAGCSSDGDDDDAGTAGTGGTSSNPGGVTIPITDTNQYTSQAALDIPTIETVAGDITIDWSGVTNDLLCHDVEQMDLVNASFLKFAGMTEEEVEAELTKSRPDTNKAEYWDHAIVDAETSATLSTYERLGSGDLLDVDTDFAISDEDTYLVTVQVSTAAGVGTKSMVFVKPAEEGAQTVEIGPGCPTPPILDFTAQLDKPKIAFPSAAPWIVGWRDVFVDGTGGDIVLTGIDKLLVGFYPDMTTEDLERDFFDIEELASPMWELSINGTDLKGDLSDAYKRNADGTVGNEKFSGFDEDGEGTWLVALTCSTCQNPQPVILAILDPSGS